jgi:hypothetical protein
MAAVAITATGFIPSSLATIVEDVTAGAAVTRGQGVYLESASNTYKLYDADSATAEAKVWAGFACQDVGVGQKFDLCTKDPALALGGTIAAGTTLWGSTTAGGVTTTIADLVSGTKVTVLGNATASGVVNYNPVPGGTVP